MLDDIKNIKSNKKEYRKFGITVGIVLLIFAAFFFFKGKPAFQPALIAGLGLIIFGLLLPIILKPIYWIWMVFATILGWIMTRVILGLLFYLIFTIVGFISRISGKKFLDLKWDKAQDTFWNYRNSQPLKEDYEKQF